jgi:hypothetical protein
MSKRVINSMGLGDDGSLNISDYTDWAASGATTSAPSSQSLVQLLPGEATPGTSPFSLTLAAGLIDSAGNPIVSSGAAASGAAASGAAASGAVVPFTPAEISMTTWLVVGAVGILLLTSMTSKSARYGR